MAKGGDRGRARDRERYRGQTSIRRPFEWGLDSGRGGITEFGSHSGWRAHFRKREPWKGREREREREGWIGGRIVGLSALGSACQF